MHATQPSIMVDPGDTARRVRTIPSLVIPSQLDTYLTIGNGHHELCLAGDAATLLAMFRAAADMLDAHYLPCGCSVGHVHQMGKHPATCSLDARTDPEPADDGLDEAHARADLDDLRAQP